ncbi:MAG: RHS repeat-associated core domain-containing protein [Thaumarchaeota archaeon]|nr:RHS repeat-associated core domain-containing protein [Nitrososphaerota archaeon]MBI3640892.1 RHS repeat-associated core domain-containing protein [Nitrososphaerota archaeon]
MTIKESTSDISNSDRFDELAKETKSAQASSTELTNNVNEAVGIYLKENDEGAISKDHQKELEDLLGKQNSQLIKQAQDNYYKQKAQLNPEGSQLSKDTKADPVMMFNGQYMHTVKDIQINGAGIGFVFTRTYKNQVYYNGPLGFNWNHNYDLWLRVEGQSIVRSSGEIREDRYIKQTNGDYYVPPEGYYDIIESHGSSFVLKTPSGTKFFYEQIGASIIHRINKIVDKNGNYLAFFYNMDDLLEIIEINNPKKKVEFHYDTANRIDQIKVYPVTYVTGNAAVTRIWRYTYDDFGDLVAVTTPPTERYTQGLTTRYEYSSSSFSGMLMHNLLRITDPVGNLYLENEFGIQKGLLSYNRVVRQRQGNGEYLFDYNDIISEQTWNYTPEETPAHSTILYQRNGHAVEHIYNKFGNLIVKKEKILQGCDIKEFVSRYRYNKDGLLIGSLSPEGSVVQYYYGREDFYNSKRANHGDNSINPSEDPNLSKDEILKFGNLLAVVKRGRYYDFTQMTNNRGIYGDFFPDIFVSDADDIITKFTYEPDYQQVASVSDPRHTKSADPRDTEVTTLSSDYNLHLTKYEYNPSLQAKNLKSINYTDTNFPSPLPDGTSLLTGIKEEYLQYDNKGRIRKIKDPEGGITEYQYFSGASPDEFKEGYLQKEIHAVGVLDLTTEHEINEIGLVTAITNPRNFRTQFIVNELDQTIEIISAGPAYKTKSFFDRNNLLERQERDDIDDNGHPSTEGPEVKTYKYDAQNNLLKETIGGSDLTQHHLIQHVYNSSDKRVKTILPERNEIAYEYEERLFLKAITRASCSPVTSTTRTIYDGNGRKAMIVDGRGNTTTFKYDPFDRLITIVDANENVHQMEYDKLGNMTLERFFEKSNGKYYLLSRKSYDYDERGNKIRDLSYLFEEPIHSDPFNKPDDEFNKAQTQGLVTSLVTQYFYDKKKRIFRILNAKGQETTYQYDTVDRKIQETDRLGNYSTYTYDKNSNLTRLDRWEIIIDQHNAFVRNEVFSTIYDYDELDRKRFTTDSLGNKTEFNYDSRNNLVKVTDALGNVSRFEFDIFNRKFADVQEITDTGLGTGTKIQEIKTVFSYDDNNNLTSITDARGAKITYSYDELDRQTGIIYHDNSFKEIEYDANSNITVTKDNNGLLIINTYDVLNRKLRLHLDKTKVSPQYPPFANDIEEYEYDGLGRTVLQKNNFSAIKTKYDSLSRSYKEEIKFDTPYTHPTQTLVLMRTFDETSNRTGIIYTDGREIEYIYDNLNRIKRIINKTKGTAYPGSATFPTNYEIVRHEYGGLRLFKTIYGNQSGCQLFYDGLGRIISIKHTDAGNNTLLEIQQMYDGVGNKRFEINLDGTTTTGRAFKYDSLYRLTKYLDQTISPITVANYSPPTAVLLEDALDGQLAINNTIGSLAHNQTDYIYKYDPLGNRIEEKQQGHPTITYQANLLNEYQQIDGKNLQYDLNGNLIEDDDKKYFYNYRNQLILVQDKTNVDLVNMVYDTLGRLIMVKESAIISHLVNDGFNVVEEYNGSNLTTQYVYENSIDKRCQIATNAQEFWYHTDLINSTRLLTKSDGQMVVNSECRYFPFGDLMGTSSSFYGNSYLFSGKRRLVSLPFYCYFARTYLPQTGRFLQRDVKGFIDGLNLYTFVSNNPINFVDLFGMEKTKENFNEMAYRFQQKLVTLDEQYVEAIKHGDHRKAELIIKEKGMLLDNKSQLRSYQAKVEYDSWDELVASIVVVGLLLKTYYEIANTITLPAQMLSGVGEARMAAKGISVLEMGEIESVSQITRTSEFEASIISPVYRGVNAKGQLALPADPKAMDAYNMANRNYDILVIGRKTDTAIAKDWPGHQTLDLPKDDWRQGINDAWMQGGIDRRATFYNATTPSNATLQPSEYGRTVFERELIQLRTSGYIQSGDNMIRAR